MVLAERNTELVRNGRRSRGPSPNGHGGGGSSVGSAHGLSNSSNSGGMGGGGGGGVPIGSGGSGSNGGGGAGTPETSSDDDNSIKRNGKSKTKQSEYEEKIRVGRDYQAVCPPLVPTEQRKPEVLNDRALLVWSPTKDIPDTKLEEYISVAKEKYGYNGEQALGMLFWHKHDLERAVMDLANFTPFPDEWTMEDKVLFEQAFQFHGKSFHRIRQMLPDKSIASLVKYYYSWKKTRHRQSVMDRQEKVKTSKEGSEENGSDNGSNEESDIDDKIQLNKQQITTIRRKNSDNTDEVRPPEAVSRINSRWTNDELLLAVQGVRKYGRDFQTIAEIIGTKTEAHVRTFFVNYRRRYNLDQVLKQHDADKELETPAATADGVASGSSVSAVNEKASGAVVVAATAAALSDESKKKESSSTSIVADESDNTNSSETTASKSINEELTTKSTGSSGSTPGLTAAKDDNIVEIDLESEQNDETDSSTPPAKRICLGTSQDFTKLSVV